MTTSTHIDGAPDRYAVRFADAHRCFPEALVAFDLQCSDVHDAEDLTFRLYRKNGTYSQGGGYISRDRLLVRANGKQFVWHPTPGVWVRFSTGIKSTPYRPPPKTIWNSIYDPTTAPGIMAPVGQLLLRTVTGDAYLKVTTENTGWKLLRSNFLESVR